MAIQKGRVNWLFIHYENTQHISFTTLQHVQTQTQIREGQHLAHVTLASSQVPLGTNANGEVRGKVGKEWTMMEPNSEIKLVRVSERTSVLAFKCEIRVLGLLAYLCMWDSHVRF